MSQKVEIDGVETEVFTATEVEAQKQAALEAFRKENPDVSQDIDKLEKQIAERETELKKLKEKDMNFGNLRQQVDDLKKDLDTKVSAAKKEVLEGVLQDHFSETLKILSHGDDELQKKIEFHYKRIQDVAATREEVNKKLTDAWTLATRVEQPDALNSSVISSGGVARIRPGSGKSQFSAEEKALAQKMAASVPGLDIKLEDKDFEKPLNITRGGTGSYEQM